MSSSAQDIPSTAYKGRSAASGSLDPVTVIRPAGGDSKSSEPPTGEPINSSAMGKLFPPEENRASQAELPAGLKLGEYTVEARIGAGGMGAVFKALDERLDRPVALKILSPSQASDPGAVRRFQNEARAAARLDHDNVARIYGVGEAHGLHYIAFEYVEGITVRELIRQRGVVAPHETINFMLQISVALKHAAAAGVVHRDIKPSNLIMTPDGRAKLVDWGLARKERFDEQSNDLTVSGTTLGTFDYISPEQARDPRNVDVRSDIYSLGCTCYHMLTGSPPYAEGTVLQKLLDHQGKHAPDPRDRNPNVPRELSRIVRKMMASDPDDRYWSPQALTHDLLVLASDAGLKPVHPDGLTWRDGAQVPTSRLPNSMFWWWLGAFGLACVVAIVADGWIVRQNSSFVVAPPVTDDGAEENATPPFFEPPRDQITNRDERLPNLTNPAGSDLFSDGSADLTFLLPQTLDHALSVPGDMPPPITGEYGSKSEPNAINRPWIYPGTVTEWDEMIFPEREPGMVKVDARDDLSPGADAMPRVDSNSPQTPLPSVTASPFRVLAVNGEFIQDAADLESALMVVPDGGVIEFQSPETKTTVLKPRSLRIVDKGITLRAAPETQLILRFDASDLNGEVRANELININGGALTLSNVHLQVVTDATVSQPWTLFAMEGSGRLRCRQSTITIDSEFQTSASIVKLIRSNVQPVDSMSNDGLSDEISRRVQFDDCVIRGAADLVVAEESEPTALEISRSLITIDGAMLRYLGDSGIQNVYDTFDIRLAGVASITNDGILRADMGMTLPRQPMEMRVRAEDSILIGQADRPLAQLTASLENSLIQELLYWDGEHNLYSGWDEFLSIRGNSSLAASPTSLNFESWTLGADQIKEVSSRLLKNATPPDQAGVRYDQWTARRFLSILHENGSGKILAGDLGEYGPDFFDLPVPPPLFEVAPLGEN
ncbi:MAG: serine/threonine protein kinase [Rubinisphaera brasiliensis]|uniref:serine/threonine protein kinase n=1 Tax=Rubinisphaera brasiliensis TaxID=119 RepID=UPI00391885D7